MLDETEALISNDISQKVRNCSILRVAVDSYGSKGVCGIPGGVGIAIDIDNGFLSQVDPEDVFLISVLLQDWLKALLKSFNGGLACAKEGESREPSEVGCSISSGSSFSKPVNAFKGISHGLEFCGWWRHLEFLMFWKD